jgi:hypothetical protein
MLPEHPRCPLHNQATRSSSLHGAPHQPALAFLCRASTTKHSNICNMLSSLARGLRAKRLPPRPVVGKLPILEYYAKRHRCAVSALPRDPGRRVYRPTSLLRCHRGRDFESDCCEDYAELSSLTASQLREIRSGRFPADIRQDVIRFNSSWSDYSTLLNEQPKRPRFVTTFALN